MEVSHCSAFIYSVSSNLANLSSMVLRSSFHVKFSSSNNSRHFMDSCFILCFLIFKFGNWKRKRNIGILSVLLDFWEKIPFLTFSDQFIIVRLLFSCLHQKIENAYIYIYIYIYKRWLINFTVDSLGDSHMILLQGKFKSLM